MTTVAPEHHNTNTMAANETISHGGHGTHGVDSTDHATHNGTHGGATRKPYDYGGNPLARAGTTESARYPAFGGEFQPGSYAPSQRKFANPAPLGLSAFALTTFILSLINMRARNVMEPNLVVASAYGYGGLVQLLAGMWYVIIKFFEISFGE